MRSAINDLTQGPIARKLIRFSLPFVFANLLQSFYMIVDMAVIGRAAGSSALAAVSIGGDVL
ncbi:MAG: MATE family efflux transporter, partial [Clostridia bacterium]|nr:MATE family efflux transporter [Clostridia bacterium]